MRKLTWAIIVMNLSFLSACVSKPNLQEECEQQGGSQYWHCKKGPWYAPRCVYQ